MKRNLLTFVILTAFLLLVGMGSSAVLAAQSQDSVDANVTYVINPDNLQGWAFLSEGGTGTNSFMLGPGTPPIGTGSVRMVITNPNDRYILYKQGWNGILLSNITSLSYYTYQDLTSSDDVLHIPALIINIDYDLTDQDTNWQGRIHYQPYLNGTPLKGVWQNWLTLDGVWWADSAPGDTFCPKATPCLWSDLLDNFPDAGLSSFFPAIGFQVGEGWMYEWIGNVDKFVIGVSGGNTETYDFEPNHSPVLATIGPKSGNELTQISFTASATDADTFNTLTFSLDAGAPSGASINPSTGAFTWTPTEAQGPGVYPVTVRVTDNGTPALNDFETIQITVNEVNVAPILGAIGNKSVNELVLLSFTATATDADLPANTLTFSLDAGAPSGASINPSTGAFTWTPTEAQGPGIYPVTVRVTDNGTPSLNDFELIQITVNEVNLAPTLATIGNKSGNELTLISFTASATDPDNFTTLVFSLDAGAPSGASINPSTGAFTWTPTEAQGPGVYPVTVRVTDNGTPALNDFETIQITVNEVNLAPTLAVIGNKSSNELTVISFTAIATDLDLPANTLTFSLDAGAPSGASINPSTGAFTWTPTEAQGPGIYPVTVRVTDNGTPSLNDFELIQITVNEVNVAPTLAAIGNKSVYELHLISFTAAATDPDLPANTLTFSLDAGAPSGASINLSTGAFTWTPTNAQGPGVYSVTVRVTDNGTPSLNDFETIQITVLTNLLYLPIINK